MTRREMRDKMRKNMKKTERSVTALRRNNVERMKLKRKSHVVSSILTFAFFDHMQDYLSMFLCFSYKFQWNVIINAFQYFAKH